MKKHIFFISFCFCLIALFLASCEQKESIAESNSNIFTSSPQNTESTSAIMRWNPSDLKNIGMQEVVLPPNSTIIKYICDYQYDKYDSNTDTGHFETIFSPVDTTWFNAFAKVITSDSGKPIFMEIKDGIDRIITLDEALNDTGDTYEFYYTNIVPKGFPRHHAIIKYYENGDTELSIPPESVIFTVTSYSSDFLTPPTSSK